MIVVGTPPRRAVEVGVGIREVIACFSNMAEFDKTWLRFNACKD
jgi:hypothetical protein